MGLGLLLDPVEDQDQLNTSFICWIAFRLLLPGGALTTALLAEIEPREIILRAVAADARNWRIARNYEFSERVDARELDSAGRLKSADVKIHHVMLLDGSPYRRLTGRDDRPLMASDEKKEQQKLTRSAAGRQKETAAQRAVRLAEYDRRPEWRREAWLVLPEAYDFRLVGEQVWEGRGVYVIEAAPRREYQPRSSTARIMTHLRGTLHVDKQDYHLVRAEVEALDTISVGLILVRLARGSRAAFEQTWVNEEVWMPRRVYVSATARLGLLKVLRIEQEVVYSNSREFEATSVSLLRSK